MEPNLTTDDIYPGKWVIDDEGEIFIIGICPDKTLITVNIVAGCVSTFFSSDEVADYLNEKHCKSYARPWNIQNGVDFSKDGQKVTVCQLVNHGETYLFFHGSSTLRKFETVEDCTDYLNDNDWG